jgi:hypothetical protein
VKKILLLGAVLSIALMGCGSGSSGAADTGGGAAPAVVSLKDKIVGTWKMDVDSVKMSMLTDEFKKTPQYDEMKKGLAKVTLEIKSDGTYSGSGPDDKPSTGKWSLSEKTITLTPDKKEEAKDQPIMTVNEDGNRIHAASPPGSPQPVEMDFVKA